MSGKKKSAAVDQVDEEAPTPEDRIEDALQAASETQPSWKHRCHAILGALGYDFGNPDWEMPEEAKQKNMLIDCLVGALGENAPMVSLQWPRDPQEAFASYGIVPAFGRAVPMTVEIRKTDADRYELSVDGNLLDQDWVTLEGAMLGADTIYQDKIDTAIRERATEAGGTRRPKLHWKGAEAWTPMGTFRVHAEADDDEDLDFFWQVQTHDGVHRDPTPFSSRQQARKAAEQHFALTLASCFSLGDQPLDFDPASPAPTSP